MILAPRSTTRETRYTIINAHRGGQRSALFYLHDRARARAGRTDSSFRNGLLATWASVKVHDVSFPLR